MIKVLKNLKERIDQEACLMSEIQVIIPSVSVL